MKTFLALLAFAAAPVFAQSTPSPFVIIDECLEFLSKENPIVLVDPTLEDGAYNIAVVDFIAANAPRYDVAGIRRVMAQFRPHSNHESSISRMIHMYLQHPRVMAQIPLGDFVGLLRHLDTQSRDYLLPILANSEASRIEVRQVLALADLTSNDSARHAVLIYFFTENKSGRVLPESRLNCDEILLLLTGWRTDDRRRNASGIARSLLGGTLCGPLTEEQRNLAQHHLDRLTGLLP